MNKLIKKSTIIITIALLTILFAKQITATIDIATPTNNYATNQLPVDFSAYVTPKADNCTLLVGGEVIDRAYNAEGLITITASPPQGTYPWKIICDRQNQTTGEVITEESETRFITIDQEAPRITVENKEELNNSLDGTPISIVTINFTTIDQNPFTCTAEIIPDNNGTNGTPVLSKSYNSTYYNTTTIFDNILIVDDKETLSTTAGDGEYYLTINCTDKLNNSAEETQKFSYKSELPPLYVNISTDKKEYPLGTYATLTIDATQNANITLQICPDEEGFVQCVTPIITNNTYPQTISLPTSKAGSYIVDAYATRTNPETGLLESEHDSIKYNITNTLTVEITTDRTPRIDREFTISAEASNGIPPYTYEWTLSNGTTTNDESVKIKYDIPGTYTEQVTVTDSEGNSIEKNKTFTIEPLLNIRIEVVDDEGNPVSNATVQLNDDSGYADEQGVFTISLPEGYYDLYVGKEGYSFYLQREEFTAENYTRKITINREDLTKPQVKITSPSENEEVAGKIVVKVNVEDNNPDNCVLYYDLGGDGWFSKGPTITINKSGEYEFPEQVLSSEKAILKVECTDKTGNKGVSKEVPVTINHELTPASEGSSEESTSSSGQATGKNDDALDDELDSYDEIIDNAYNMLSSLTARENEAADYLGLRKMIDDYARTINRYERDLNDLQYRRDLTDAEKEQRREDIRKELKAVINEIPKSIKVTNSKSAIKYLRDDELEKFSEILIKSKGLSFKPSYLAKKLLSIQQEFTSKSTFMNVVVETIGGRKEYTIMSFDNQFSELVKNSKNDNYKLLFYFPESVATNSRQVLGMSRKEGYTGDESVEVWSEANPVILSVKPQERITFYVERRVDLSKLDDLYEVLYKEIPKPSGITGAVLGGDLSISFDWKTSLFLSLIIMAILYLLGHSWDKVEFLIYELSPKKEAKELRALVDEILAELRKGDYEKANLLYEELRLSYDKASHLVKNDLYDDVMRVLHELDQAYLMKLTDRIHEAIERGDLESAIDDFERLEGTYERLPPEAQKVVYDTLLLIARKLGLEDELHSTKNELFDNNEAVSGGEAS